MEAYGVGTLKELSTAIGNKPNWAASTKQRGTIPYDACVNTAVEKGISVDYLLFGEGEPVGELALKTDAIDTLAEFEHLGLIKCSNEDAANAYAIALVDKQKVRGNVKSDSQDNVSNE